MLCCMLQGTYHGDITICSSSKDLNLERQPDSLRVSALKVIRHRKPSRLAKSFWAAVNG